MHFSYVKIKNDLTLCKLVFVCNYFYSETVTTVIIVMGVIVF